MEFVYRVAQMPSTRCARVWDVARRVCASRLAARAHTGVHTGVRVFAVVFCVLTMAATRPVVASEPVPPWCVGESAIRMVFVRGAQDAFALCVLPSEVGGRPVAAVKADAAGEAQPIRVVAADDRQIHVLVDCQELPEKAMVAVYGIAGEQRVDPELEGVVDPTPIRVAARHSVGQDPPATLNDLNRLVIRRGPQSTFFVFPDFDAVAAGLGRFSKGAGWDRPLALLRLTSWLAVPQEGRYVFSLSGENAAWLQINGEEVVGQEYNCGRPTIQEGPPITLTAGLHRLIVDTAVRTNYSLGVQWRPVDTNAARPTLVTGGALMEGRVERRDGDLHVFARTRRGLPYRFQGIPALFCPVTLEDESVCWSGGTLAYAWQINGAPVGNGRRVETILVATNGTNFVVGLTVSRAADGTNGSTTITLPAATVPAAEYRLSSVLIGAPAVCYGNDPVNPEIQVRATSPDATDFILRVELDGHDGPPVVSETPLTLTRSWGRVVLPAGEADTFREIRWQVLHAGVVLHSGRWVFDVPPFESLPDAVDGVSLLRGGAGVTLIARRASRGEDARFKGLRRGQRLLFLDGFVAAAGVVDPAAAEQLDRAVANGPDGVSVAYQRRGLQTLEQADDPRGGARLTPLAALRGVLPVDAVLLAPDLSGARDGETLESFERMLAAFAGALTEAGQTHLILVAPPAFDVLPGCGCKPGPAPCVHARAGRLYAEIVYRVADAYGLIVADLYTAFSLDAGDQPLIVGGVLTPSGMRKAAEVFRRVLYPMNR